MSQFRDGQVVAPGISHQQRLLLRAYRGAHTETKFRFRDRAHPGYVIPCRGKNGIVLRGAERNASETTRKHAIFLPRPITFSSAAIIGRNLEKSSAVFPISRSKDLSSIVSSFCSFSCNFVFSHFVSFRRSICVSIKLYQCFLITFHVSRSFRRLLEFYVSQRRINFFFFAVYGRKGETLFILKTKLCRANSLILIHRRRNKLENMSLFFFERVKCVTIVQIKRR